MSYYKELKKIDFKEYNEMILKILWTEDITYCICWSWKKFNQCCKWGKLPPERLKDTKRKTCFFILKKEHENHLYEIQKLLDNEKCVIDSCNTKACHSHLYPENKIRKNNWNEVWGFCIDKNWGIFQKWKNASEIREKVWCSEHDKTLFKLTDNELFSKLWTNTKKDKYANELLNKNFGFKKVLESRRFRVLYTFWLYYFLKDWQIQAEKTLKGIKLSENYKEYTQCCKIFDSLEYFRIRNEKAPQLQYFYIKWDEECKCYGTFCLKAMGRIDYLIYLQPKNKKISAFIFKINKDIPSDYDSKIKNIVLKNGTLWLIWLLNEQLPWKSRYCYNPEKKLIFMSKIPKKVDYIIKKIL